MGDTSTAIRVLIVDDNASVRRQMANLLNVETGIEVVATAGTSNEAMRLLKSRRVDVVIMDVRLPGETGIEATRRIKTLMKGVDVIVVSMLDSAEVKKSAAEAGASDYIVKGGPIEEISQSVRRAVRRRQS